MLITFIYQTLNLFRRIWLALKMSTTKAGFSSSHCHNKYTTILRVRYTQSNRDDAAFPTEETQLYVTVHKVLNSAKTRSAAAVWWRHQSKSRRFSHRWRFAGFWFTWKPQNKKENPKTLVAQQKWMGHAVFSQPCRIRCECSLKHFLYTVFELQNAGLTS